MTVIVLTSLSDLLFTILHSTDNVSRLNSSSKIKALCSTAHILQSAHLHSARTLDLFSRLLHFSWWSLHFYRLKAFLLMMSNYTKVWGESWFIPVTIVNRLQIRCPTGTLWTDSRSVREPAVTVIRQMGIRGTEEVERRTEGEYRRCWNLVSGLIFLCWTSVSCGTDPSERMFICLECVEDKQHVTVTMSLLIRSAVQQFSCVVSGLQPYRETDTKLVFFFFFFLLCEVIEMSHWTFPLKTTLTTSWRSRRDSARISPVAGVHWSLQLCQAQPE